MIYHIVYIPVIYRLNMDGQKTTTKNGEPRLDADIRNMEVGLGLHQWDGLTNESGLTAGSISIRLPNGTRIDITSTSDGADFNNVDIDIHRIEDSVITVFEKSSSMTKKAFCKSKFTLIMKKVA